MSRYLFFPVFVIIFSISKCRDVSLMKKDKMRFLDVFCISYTTTGFLLRGKRVSPWNRKLSLSLVVSTCISSLVHTTHSTFLESHGIPSYSPWVHCDPCSWDMGNTICKRRARNGRHTYCANILCPCTCSLSQWASSWENEPCPEAHGCTAPSM